MDNRISSPARLSHLSKDPRYPLHLHRDMQQRKDVTLGIALVLCRGSSDDQPMRPKPSVLEVEDLSRRHSKGSEPDFGNLGLFNTSHVTPRHVENNARIHGVLTASTRMLCVKHLRESN